MKVIINDVVKFVGVLMKIVLWVINKELFVRKKMYDIVMDVVNMLNY